MRVTGTQNTTTQGSPWAHRRNRDPLRTYAMSGAIDPTTRAMPSVRSGHRRAIGSTGA
jgi:hypothetical protein